MLYHWKVYHFHLSTENEIKKPYFKVRSNDLLFVHITRTTAYVLGFDQHGDEVFGNVRWLEIIENNWPWLIEKYKDKKIKKIYPDPNAKDREIFWKKGYTLGMTNVNGTIYHDPGFGITSSGHSYLVVSQAGNISRWLNDVRKWYDENKVELHRQIIELSGITEEKINIKARLTDDIEVFDEASGVILCTYNE